MSILDKIQKPQQEEFITDLLIEYREKTFTDLFNHLETLGKLQWFADSKIGDLIKLPQLKKAEEKEVSDLEEYKKDVLAFLKEYGKGESKMGALSREIIESVGGTGVQLRKVLDELRSPEVKKVASVGKTQGMRHALYKFKDAIEAEYLKKPAK
jgi:hypothetical protein